MLFCLLLSACGSSDGSTEGTTQPYKVSQLALEDATNVYPHLKGEEGACLAGYTSNCTPGVGRSISRYKSGEGFVGFSYGLAGQQISGIDLDPFVEDEVLSVYSGPAATYSAKHSPVAVGSENYVYFVYSGPALLDDNKTVASTAAGGEVSTASNFFRADGKSNALGIYVARYNKLSGRVSAPLLLHVKHTDDPHDNAVLNLDAAGNLFVLISGRSAKRSALMYFIEQPDTKSVFAEQHLNIREISPDNLNYQTLGLQNFSAPQLAPITYPHLLRTNQGLRLVYSLYCFGGPEQVCRGGTRQLWTARLVFTPEKDKAALAEARPLAAFGGHYAVVRTSSDGQTIAVAFNAHFDGDVAKRTNLYMLFSTDGGTTWNYFDPDTGATRSAESFLPLQSASALGKVAVRELHSPGQQVTQRVYLKDVLLGDEIGAPRPIILYTLAEGANSHIPTTRRIHSMEVSIRSSSQWIHRSLSNELDHNFSTGALVGLGEDQIRVFFPATPTDKGNALAGGGLASLDFGLTREKSYAPVNYYSEVRAPGISGYMQDLCEVNYIRPVVGRVSDAFTAIGSAANPYRFESSLFNSQLPASPLLLADRAGNWFRLPMRLTNQDVHGEVALEPVSSFPPLNCNHHD